MEVISHDMEAAELSESHSEDDHDKRPIMLLLKRLIRNKQNTVMTNTQIIEILKQEFNINVLKCHEMEVDIYIKIIKKYLKDWPQWEELERISSKLSSAKDFEAVTKVLNHKYKNLKEYLGVMLDAAKPLAKKAVADTNPVVNKDVIDSKEVVMEVYCTRKQLNHLVYRKPSDEVYNAVFNISKIDPTRISLNTLSFESILNFCSMKVYVHLPFFVFVHGLTYDYKHTLINKNRPQQDRNPAEILDTRLQMKARKSTSIKNTEVVKCFDALLDEYKDDDLHGMVKLLIDIFKKDLEIAPYFVDVPASYRRHANQYKYVRYLYVDNNESEESDYDLQLQEIVSPTYNFYLGRFIEYADKVPMFPSIEEWLKIECVICKVKFCGSSELMSLLEAHFNDYHQHEPDWQCCNCDKSFNVSFLAKNSWSHICG